MSRPEPAKAQYLFTPIDVPGRPRRTPTAIARTRLWGSLMMRTANTHGFVLSKGVFTQIRRAQRRRLHQRQRNQRQRRTVRTLLRGRSATTDISGARACLTRSTRPARPSRSPSPSTRKARSWVLRGCQQNTTRLVWGKGIVHHDRRTRRRRPGGTRVIGINDHGQIVGSYGDTGQHHSRVRALQGRLHDARRTWCRPGGFTTAEGINNSGQIVGYYSDADGTSHGFILSRWCLRDN